jgi:hypothetical protein
VTCALCGLLVASASGCKTRTGVPAPAEPAVSVSHDARVVGRLLSLPAAPVEVAFEETPRGIPSRLGPTDYLLVAVLRFEPGVVSGFATQAAAETSTPGLVSVPNRAWLPPALKAKFVRVEGDTAVVHGHELAAESWLRPGYMGGAIAVDGTDYVVVCASTS